MAAATVTLTKGNRSEVFELHSRRGDFKLYIPNVKQVFGLSALKLNDVNVASHPSGFSVLSFWPGAELEVSGEPGVQEAEVAAHSGEGGLGRCRALAANITAVTRGLLGVLKIVAIIGATCSVMDAADFVKDAAAFAKAYVVRHDPTLKGALHVVGVSTTAFNAVGSAAKIVISCFQVATVATLCRSLWGKVVKRMKNPQQLALCTPDTTPVGNALPDGNASPGVGAPLVSNASPSAGASPVGNVSHGGTALPAGSTSPGGTSIADDQTSSLSHRATN